MNVRANLQTVLLLCLVLPCSAAMAHAQRGGGMGRGGMGGGGGMGAPPNGDNRGMDEGMMPPHDRRMDMTARIRTEPAIALPGRWWDDHHTIKSLKLRPDQQHRMDAIFESNKNTLITLYSNLQQEQQRFVNMRPEDLQDQSKVFAEIDRVEQDRAALEKERFYMLMQIRKEMDPQQLKNLDKKIAEAENQ